MNERQLLLEFFMFFRNNGENYIGITMEEFIELFLKLQYEQLNRPS
jgi:hypothetical protein